MTLNEMTFGEMKEYKKQLEIEISNRNDLIYKINNKIKSVEEEQKKLIKLKLQKCKEEIHNLLYKEEIDIAFNDVSVLLIDKNSKISYPILFR